jgi:hypothetical protein
MKQANFEKRIKDLQAKIGEAAGLPPVAIRDESGLYNVPNHEPMTREEYERLVEPWMKIGLPAVVVSCYEPREKTKTSR